MICLRTRWNRQLALVMMVVGGTAASVHAQGDANHDAFPRQGTVTADTLNVRARPGLFYEVIAKLAAQQQIQVLGRHEDWLRIPVPADAEAWVAVQFLGDGNRMTGDGVRVRAGAGVAFTPYHTLDEGAIVQRAGEERNGWVRIAPPADAGAWVSGQFVELAPPPVEAKASVAEDDETAPAEGDGVAAAPGEADAVAGPDDDASHAEAETPKEREVIAATDLKPPQRAQATSGEGPVDLRERIRRQGSPEARGVEMLPPIRLPEEADHVDPREAVYTTPFVTVRQAPEKKQETVSAGERGVENPPTEASEGVDEQRRAPDAADDAPEAGRGDSQVTEREQAVPPVPAAFRVSGLVVSLGERANQAASHVLLKSESGRMVPVAYLKGHSVDLSEWEGRSLHVYGQRIPCNWSRPLVAVKGVLVSRP